MPTRQSAHAQPDLKTLALATRPWSFAMTAISVTSAALIALPTFNVGLYLVTLLGMVLAHAATNLINDYYDVKFGVDQPDAPTARYRPHPLVDGTLKAHQVMTESVVLYALAGLIGVYLLIIRGWPIALLAIIGGIASVTYTATPVQYKYRGLGELAVFVMWGPLMMLGSLYVQTNSFAQASDVLWVSLPVGIWVALVLLANNLKDIHYDRRMGAETLGTLLGREGALGLFMALVVVAYLVTVLAIVAGALPIWSLLVFLSAPQAYAELRDLRGADEIPVDADPRTAQLSTRYGLLLVGSLILNAIVPLP
ncbi:MAG: prenyltransferase [Candidatus Bipolaricaulia bacterium]